MIENRGKGEFRKGAFKKGNIPWNKNKKGTHFSPRTEIKSGQHISPKTEFKKGQKAWNKNLTKETNELVKKNAESVKKTHWMHKLSPEEKTKIGRKMRLNQKFVNPSKPERMMRQALKDAGIAFETDKNILGRTQPDMFIEPNICVYCDGDYFHANPNEYPNPSEYTKEQKYNVKRDKWINENLPKKGFVVLRFWESDIYKSLISCVSKIKMVIAVHTVLNYGRLHNMSMIFNVQKLNNIPLLR